jgi:hypothetical protein
MVKITKLIHFLMVFMHFSIQFWTLARIRIRNLEFRIRQKVPDPCGFGSTTLEHGLLNYVFLQLQSFKASYVGSDPDQGNYCTRSSITRYCKKSTLPDFPMWSNVMNIISGGLNRALCRKLTKPPTLLILLDIF